MNKMVLISMSFTVLFFSACSGKQLNYSSGIEVSNGSVNHASTLIGGTLLGLFSGAAIGNKVDGKEGAKKGAVIGATTGLGVAIVVVNQNQKQATKEQSLGRKISDYSNKKKSVF